MMDIRLAARPGRRRIVYVSAALAGVAAGLVIGLATRPAPGRIPAEARVVTVAPVFNFQPSASPSGAFTVTDRAKVARIVAIVDGLRQLPSGTYSCPTVAGSAVILTAMQLTFRTAVGGRVVASVTAEYVDCQFAWVTVGAKTVSSLDPDNSSGQSMQQQVLAIAGVSWPDPPG